MGEDFIKVLFLTYDESNPKVTSILMTQDGIKIQGDNFKYNDKPITTEGTFYIHNVTFHNENTYNGILYEIGFVKYISTSSDTLNSFNFKNIAKGFLNGYMRVKSRCDKINIVQPFEDTDSGIKKIIVYGENISEPLGEIFISENKNYEDKVEEF